ncbi:MAG: DUF2231 domain-containing protein [Bacteroidota bacterium]
MDLLTQYDIPYLHPLAVHFPVVLLLLAMGTAWIYLATSTAVWRQAAMVFLALGAAGALWAGKTGETLEEASRGEPIVEAVVETHEDAARWTLWTALGALALFAVATVWLRRLPEPTEVGKRDPVLLRAGLALVASVPAALVAYTSHLGGIMVWGVPV